MTAIIELTARSRTFTLGADKREFTFTANPRAGIQDWWQFEDYAIVQWEDTNNIGAENTGRALVSQKRETTTTAYSRSFTLHAEQAHDETF